jgi:iron-sulfur cluster insertion protein
MNSIAISEQAWEHARKIVGEHENSIGIRIGVSGGGCSGFKYFMNFLNDGDEIAEDEIVLEDNGVKFVIDPVSNQYLDGASLELETTMGSNIMVIKNPQATRTCGCGQSFSP